MAQWDKGLLLQSLIPGDPCLEDVQVGREKQSHKVVLCLSHCPVAV